jgi:hypothetical protein
VAGSEDQPVAPAYRKRAHTMKAVDPDRALLVNADPRGIRGDVSSGVLAAGLVVTLACVAGLLVTHFLGLWLWDLRHRLLDAGSGAGLFDWVATLAVLGSAVAVGMLARHEERRGHFVLLSAILLVLFVDTALDLHHNLGAAGRVLTLPLIAPAFVLLWAHARRAPSEIARFIRIGLVLLVISFVGTEVAELGLSRTGLREGDFLYELKVALKHSTELSGWLLVLTGLAASVARARRAKLESLYRAEGSSPSSMSS